MDQSLGPDAASERVLVRVARFCNWSHKLLCQCAGDQATQEVPDHKASRATVGLAQRDDTPKSKGWHNVVRDAGTSKLGGDIRKCLGGLGIIEDNTENFCREARKAWAAPLRTAKVSKERNVVYHDGHRRLPRSKIGVRRGAGLGGAPLSIEQCLERVSGGRGQRVCQQSLPSGRQFASVSSMRGTASTRFSIRLTQLGVLRQRL